MKIKEICVTIGLFLFVSISSAFAAAPFVGGEVTAPFGEENHLGHMHKGLDVGTSSGTPILAPFNGTVEHGAGNGRPEVEALRRNGVDELGPGGRNGKWTYRQPIWV